MDKNGIIVPLRYRDPDTVIVGQEGFFRNIFQSEFQEQKASEQKGSESSARVITLALDSDPSFSSYLLRIQWFRGFVMLFAAFRFDKNTLDTFIRCFDLFGETGYRCFNLSGGQAVDEVC